MQSKKDKHDLREEAKNIEYAIIDGVTVGIQKGLSDEARDAFIEHVEEHLANPDSEFNHKRSKREAARKSFDQRRVVVAQKIDAARKLAADEASKLAESQS